MRIIFGLLIAAGTALLVNYTPLHDVTFAGGKLSLPGVLSSVLTILVLALHTISFGIIARRETLEHRSLSLGLWATFFILAVIVAFSLGVRFAADEVRSFAGDGVLPPVGDALSFFDEPFSHSIFIVSWLLMIFITVLVEQRVPPELPLERRDRNAAIAGGAIAGVLGAIFVIEGQVWWSALPVTIALALLILYKVREHHESLWNLPTTIFSIFGFFSLAIFIGLWGFIHGGFPEIRPQPLRLFDNLELQEIYHFQDQLDRAQKRIEETLHIN